jgi:protein O-GlcNAc transferase
MGGQGTTGLPQMDYWIADDLTVPEGEERYFAERVYRLRPPFLCYGPTENGPAVAEAPSVRNGYVTFGSFNNLGKLSAALMESWGKILNGVSNSRLLLKALVLADDRTREKVLALLGRHGVPVDRVELMPPEGETSQHLATYGRVDVGLDTFPFNGATTTAEALWVGVPVVTMSGNTHVSRVGLSLVTSVGLGELCAGDVAGYVATAVKLGNDVERIQRLRETMRQRVERSPLMDAKGFTRAMEAAYREMWKRWCEAGK